VSLCSEPLKELANPGASGSLFYRTLDDNFIIKTVQKKEAKFLLKLLPGYFLVCHVSEMTWRHRIAWSCDGPSVCISGTFPNCRFRNTSAHRAM
jgi:hypothetical protein